MINDGLKYDSFYKFMTSLGIIVLLIPFVILAYTFTQIDAALVAAKTYSELEYPAKELLDFWIMVPLFLNQHRRVAMAGFALDVILGAGLTGFGLFGWYSKLQKFEDRIKELESKKLENELKQASEKEIKEEKEREYVDPSLVSGEGHLPHLLGESAETGSSDSVQQGALSGYERNRAFVQEAIKVENECLDRVEYLLAGKYTLKRSMRIKSKKTNERVFFDAIATPVVDKPYAFVEVHYVRDSDSPRWEDVLDAKLRKCFVALGQDYGSTILGVVIIVMEDIPSTEGAAQKTQSPIMLSKNWILTKYVISRSRISELQLLV